MTAAHAYPTASSVPEAKVTRSLFNFQDVDGRSKGLFLIRFGFRAENPIEPMAALLEHPRLDTMTRAFEAPHGVKHYFEAPLRTPDGRDPVIRAVWQIDDDGDSAMARFITIKIRVREDVRSLRPPEGMKPVDTR